jgi:hypothetical protein
MFQNEMRRARQGAVSRLSTSRRKVRLRVPRTSQVDLDVTLPRIAILLGSPSTRPRGNSWCRSRSWGAFLLSAFGAGRTAHYIAPLADTRLWITSSSRAHASTPWRLHLFHCGYTLSSTSSDALTAAPYPDWRSASWVLSPTTTRWAVLCDCPRRHGTAVCWTHHGFPN